MDGHGWGGLTMGYYLGIDPGTSGGCAVLDEKGRIAKVFKFKNLTLHDLAHEMCVCKRSYNIKKAVLEKVHSMPGQGVASSFKFGKVYGHVEMALTGLQIPYDLVTPQKWMKKLGCMTRGDKNVTKALAQRRWPDKKIIHAIADCLLIAEYCRMIDKGL